MDRKTLNETADKTEDMEKLDKLAGEFEAGIAQEKCRKCGCMKGALEEVLENLRASTARDAVELKAKVEAWLGKAEESLYTWLGCKHCYPAVATNLFQETFPSTDGPAAAVSETEPTAEAWPPISGEYIVLRGHERCRAAVSTLASTALADELARLAPQELCIVGKTETENIGIEKIIKNTITNPSLHVLVVAGREPEGHRSGATLLALCRSGVDGKSRVIGSPGLRPILKNVTPQEIEAFRRQIAVVDMIGCEDPEEIVKRIVTASGHGGLSCGGSAFSRTVKPVAISTVDVIQAEPSRATQLDKAGYFVILPLKDKESLSVEHYSNDNRLLRIIEGKDVVSIYKTILENGWVTQLSHAAYLGKELDRAELSMKLDFKYVQDGI